MAICQIIENREMSKEQWEQLSARASARAGPYQRKAGGSWSPAPPIQVGA